MAGSSGTVADHSSEVGVCSHRDVAGPHNELVAAVRDGLAAIADPAKAPAMQAYMKSAMPFRGVPTPERRQLTRDVVARTGPPTDRSAWEATVRELWDGATYREERYVAVDLCALRVARPWQDAATVPLYTHLVDTGSWWDHVDAVATGLLGPVLAGDRATVEPVVRSWITDPDLWRRRTSIIVQARAKRATDTVLLADAITANLDDREFFIRKAIGWALRDFARTDPAWVRAFVDDHAGNLSPLSRREAMKHL
jgi:3-methyladenine DNA glycosylase AlkD